MTRHAHTAARRAKLGRHAHLRPSRWRRPTWAPVDASGACGRPAQGGAINERLCPERPADDEACESQQRCSARSPLDACNGLTRSTPKEEKLKLENLYTTKQEAREQTQTAELSNTQTQTQQSKQPQPSKRQTNSILLVLIIFHLFQALQTHLKQPSSGARGLSPLLAFAAAQDEQRLFWAQEGVAHQQTRRQQRNHPHRQPHSAQRRRHAHQADFEGGGFGPVNAERPLVATAKGLVRGITQKVFTGKAVDAYLGIPFAVPPVGRYRFRHPQPAQAWQGELDASRMPNSCYQVNDTYFGANFHGTSIWNANTPLSEDCLYLNVWTPFNAANTSLMGGASGRQPSDGGASSRRAVLVWIFGGGFYSGTSTLAIYEGGALASEEDVIVVSMNYRVSSLGFLYLGRPDAPGNAGMFDQLMALQWVNDNIHNFGGDPARVTIFGESAGAVSVAFHLLSPLSRNLFSQAILQSGAATCPWGYKEPKEMIDNGLELAGQLNCPTNKSQLEQVLECLLRARPLDLVSKEVGHTRAVLNFAFVPVIDGSFLIESPIESLAKANFKPANILLGSNYDEGNSFLIYLQPINNCHELDLQASENGHASSTDDQAGGPQQQQQQQQQQNQQATSGDQSMQSVQGSGNQPSERTELLAVADELQPPAQLALSRLAAAVKEQQRPLASNATDSKTCKPNERLTLTRDDFLAILKDGLNPYAEFEVGREAIVFEYSNWNNPLDPISNYDALDKIVGDFYFTCHVNELAHRYASTGNQVYMYYFKQRSSMSPWPKWMGVLHADEINFVFGEPLNALFNYTAKEVELSRRMMRYWANFAKFGNPSKSGGENTSEVKWPEYKVNRQYFELHSDFIRIGRGPRAKQCAFWAHYLPKLVESFERTSGQCIVSDTPSPVQGRPRANPFLSSVPSAVLIGSIVISVLIIVSLLAYAKRKWKISLNLLGSAGNSDTTNHRSEPAN